jgi:TolB-like protein/Flp pilus assembly protein TadD
MRARARPLGVLAVLVLGVAAFVWWRREPPLPPLADASVAVLPFAGSGEPAVDRDLAEGLGDELLDSLARVEGVRVATRSSTYAASARSRDPKTVARALGVAAVIEGTVRHAGAGVRIEALVVDGTTGAIRWSGTFDPAFDELADGQRTMLEQIVVALLGATPAVAAAAPPEQASPEAYRDFVRARRILDDNRDTDRVQLAIGLFRQVAAADGDFARAQAALCSAEVYRFAFVRDPAELDRAKQHCARAQELDPEMGEGHLAMARVHVAEGDHPAAVASYERALRDPALRARSLAGLARSNAALGNDERAQRYFEEARLLEPGYWGPWMDLAAFQMSRSRFADAAASLLAALELGPEGPDLRRLMTNLGTCYMALGEFEQGADAYERSLKVEVTHGALSNLGTLRYYLGEYESAVALYERAAAIEPDDYRTRGNIGDALLALDGKPAKRSLDQYRAAAQMASAFLAKSPGTLDARADLAWFRLNLGEKDAALRELAAAEPGAADNAQVALRIAMIHARLGDSDRARSYASDAVRLGLTEQLVYAEPLLKAFRSRQVDGSR